jgi:hypothetical protein
MAQTPRLRKIARLLQSCAKDASERVVGFRMALRSQGDTVGNITILARLARATSGS